MNRILAVDLGSKRIGLALSDPLGYTASGLETYKRTEDAQKDADYVASLANERGAPCILLGLPKNMDGSCGFMCDMVYEFAKLLQLSFKGDIIYFDERLSSKSAERVLIDADVKRAKRKAVIDKLAAVIILQAYLDTKR